MKNKIVSAALLSLLGWYIVMDYCKYQYETLARIAAGESKYEKNKPKK